VARYRARLLYDGTDFHGSQYQPDVRTVQGELEKGLRKLDWSGTAVKFAGRTDAGVHASGQVIAFDHKWNHTEEDLARALNAVLPEDMAAGDVAQVRRDFEPRYDALARTYRYQIRCSPVRNPLLDRYAWRVWPEVNLKSMNSAASALVGKHDFAAFGSPHQPGGSTIRKIESAVWVETDPLCEFILVGNAFLYHMVRHIVQVLVEIGQGKLSAAAVADYLENPDGPSAPGLAPARGLRLDKVSYPDGKN